jgi:hypothetical protein
MVVISMTIGGGKPVELENNVMQSTSLFKSRTRVSLPDGWMALPLSLRFFRNVFISSYIEPPSTLEVFLYFSLSGECLALQDQGQ